MDGNFRFSLIIPFRNRITFLPELFNSIESVTYSGLEIIMVDNDSTDDSRIWIDRFINNYQGPHVYKVIFEPSIGAPQARNAGANVARGEYLYFFDSDDELSPTFFNEVEKLLPSDIIACPTRLYFENGSTKVRDVDFSNKPEMQILLGMLSTQGMVIKREFFKTCGGWNEQFKRWNDYELGVRLLLHKPLIKWIKQPFHKINVHPRSITGTSFSEDADTLLSVLKHVNQLIDYHVTNCNTRQRCKDALYGKYDILRLNLLREGNIQAAKRIIQEVKEIRLSHVLGLLHPLFMVITTCKVPLTWRLIRFYLNSFK
ncbi:MAG: glycosyltransferase [Bacteroidaceae bacterium]|nr:glycosyltransferase [Bacteroidaceae bacterium]